MSLFADFRIVKYSFQRSTRLVKKQIVGNLELGNKNSYYEYISFYHYRVCAKIRTTKAGGSCLFLYILHRSMALVCFIRSHGYLFFIIYLLSINKQSWAESI